MIALDVHSQILLRLVVAVFVGALVGYERERKGKPAGVRTHGMVCLGAVLFTVVSLYGFGAASDPTRVAAMVVSGIGFLGTGAILHQLESVHGLTTAASLWVTAAIGLAVGVGMIAMSLVTTILVARAESLMPCRRWKQAWERIRALKSSMMQTRFAW